MQRLWFQANNSLSVENEARQNHSYYGTLIGNSVWWLLDLSDDPWWPFRVIKSNIWVKLFLNVKECRKFEINSLIKSREISWSPGPRFSVDFRDVTSRRNSRSVWRVSVCCGEVSLKGLTYLPGRNNYDNGIISVIRLSEEYSAPHY